MTRNDLIGMFTTLDMERLQQVAPTINTDLVLLGCVCAEFINPPVLPKTQQEYAIVVIQRLVASEFIRLYLDKRFSDNKLGRRESKSYKEFIRLQAILWGEAWKTIQQLYALSPIKFAKPKELFFQAVIMERWLTDPFGTHADTWNESLTVTKLMKQGQNFNQLLKKLFDSSINPCDPLSKPDTHFLLQRSIELADKSDDFRKQYLKMVDARMALIDTLRHDRPKLTSSNPKVKPENRGRKPKKK
jgi:hypothetical protein